jgi:hypothetical protein
LASEVQNVTVVASSSFHPKYLNCVSSYINFWLDQNLSSANNYTPLVILVGSEVPDSLSAYKKYIVLQESVEGVSDVFVSQFVRAMYASLCDGDLVITSDIDMLPLSTGFLDTVIKSRGIQIENFDVVRDVLPLGQVPICYNIATPKTWGEVTGIRDFDDLEPRLVSEFSIAALRNSGYTPDHGGTGWFTDQEFLYAALEKLSDSDRRLRRFQDSETGHRRLDRLYMPFPINWLALPLVLMGVFGDYHVHHPIQKHRMYVSAVRKLNRMRLFLEQKVPNKSKS